MGPSSKRLSIKKMEGNDFEGAKGHHGIFDGDEYRGHIHTDDMHDYLRSCMEDGFGGIVAPDIDWKPKGHAGSPGHQAPDLSVLDDLALSGLAVDREVDNRVRETMRRDGISYGRAYKNVLASDSGLKERYRRAHAQELRETPMHRLPVEDELMTEVAKTRKQEKISFGEALQRVLSDNKDLARRYRAGDR